jgi:hypothetical protein
VRSAVERGSAVTYSGGREAEQRRREIARSVGISEGAELAQVKGEDWRRQIQSANVLATREDLPALPHCR